ncbi:MAG: glycoside hydrolase family 25 protein [Pseudomonadota bacterium]
MASSSRKSNRRKPKRSYLRRSIQLGAFIAFGALIYAGWFWFEMRSWKPDTALYPEQGAVIASGTPGVRFETLKAVGASFVYLELGAAGAPPDPGFRQRLEAALEAGLKVGIVQVFDPCRKADPHSAKFARMVARNEDLLPPAVALTRLPSSCPSRVSDAAATSEVFTLVNQLELHAGTPVILKLGEEFESRFRLAASLDRDLWLVRDRSRPRYAQRPWLLWSANSQLQIEALTQPVEWVVVQR